MSQPSQFSSPDVCKQQGESPAADQSLLPIVSGNTTGFCMTLCTARRIRGGVSKSVGIIYKIIQTWIYSSRRLIRWVRSEARSANLSFDSIDERNRIGDVWCSDRTEFEDSRSEPSRRLCDNPSELLPIIVAEGILFVLDVDRFDSIRRLIR